jgi:hypothetical protein
VAARQRPRRRFALDQNFPEPIIESLQPLLSTVLRVDLVPVRKIRTDFSTLKDWELILELHKDTSQRWDGLISNDDKMLSLAKEMTVLSQSRLTLVIIKGYGHDPVRATGVLLSHLDHICHHTSDEEGQIWRLAVTQKMPDSPTDYLERIADRTGISARTLFTQNKVSIVPPRRR